MQCVKFFYPQSCHAEKVAWHKKQKSGSDIFHCHATATYEKYSFIFLHFTYVKVASAVVVVPIVLTSYV
jgi:hypothetical protein